MRWSWKIARIADIDIYIHVTFLLLIYFIGISYWNQHGTMAAVVSGVGFILAIFGCVVLHEYGHSLTARRYGIRTRSITLLPIGGVALLENMPEDPRQEINVAIAGPVVNFVLAFILYLYLDFSGFQIAAEETGLTPGTFLHRLMMVNIFIGGFNLLPAFPMDGGRVLRAALAMRMGHAQATRQAVRIGQTIAVGMGLLGAMYNPFLMFIAIFIWFGASMESTAEQLKSILGHASVRHAMLREFHTLSPDDKLAKAVELTLAGSQKDFPVGYRNNLDKVLHYSDLIRGLQAKGEHARISELPLQNILSADINEPLGKLLQRMQGNPAQMICVTDAGQIVGLLNLENILELIKIQEAVEKHRASRG
ncbi:MAG: site-2 protease family protein [bacterium]|nr:site-2 protease family protein [bacterium]